MPSVTLRETKGAALSFDELDNNFRSLVEKADSPGAATSRPVNLKPGNIWGNTTTTPWNIYYYTGTIDIKIGEVSLLDSSFASKPTKQFIPIFTSGGTADGDVAWDSSGKNILIGDGTTKIKIISETSTATLSNKTINLASNTVSGTKAQFDTALSDDNFAFLATKQTFAKGQAGAVSSITTLSFDMDYNNFTCTPSGAGTLAFTNIVSGQSGNIRFINGSNYSISKSSYIKCPSSLLTTISATGTYWLSYYSPNGTDVLLVGSGALA